MVCSLTLWLSYTRTFHNTAGGGDDDYDDDDDDVDDDSDVDDDEGTDQRGNYLIKGGLLAAKC